MAKAPGYQQRPDHEIREKPLTERIQASVDGEIVADSTAVVSVEESHYPPRYYFPRADVRMDKLARSATTSQCPFKGRANYYSLSVAGKLLQDAVWSYEDPYDEHSGLKDRLVFYDDKFSEIVIRFPQADVT